MADELTHLDERGRAHMVGVGHKPAVRRVARARASVHVAPATAALMRDGDVPKGDVAAVARLSGIAAAKRTPDLVMLCHPLPLDRVRMEVEVAAEGLVTLEAEVETTARTGVEMEALTAVAVAALNVYDMVKGVDPAPRIGEIVLVEKRTDAGAA
jgi:cyclic pyranopterin monophosphate synthase